MTQRDLFGPVCPSCGAAVWPRSCNPCLRRFNGNGSWFRGYLARYFPTPKVPQEKIPHAR